MTVTGPVSYTHLVINGPEKTTQIIYYELRNDLITTINYYYDNVKADSETLRNFNAIYGDLILKDILIENEVTRDVYKRQI